MFVVSNQIKITYSWVEEIPELKRTVKFWEFSILGGVIIQDVSIFGSQDQPHRDPVLLFGASRKMLYESIQEKNIMEHHQKWKIEPPLDM